MVKSESGEILSYEVIRISAGQMKQQTYLFNWTQILVSLMLMFNHRLKWNRIILKQTTHIARQSGWNVRLSNFEVNDDFIEFVDRHYQIMEGQFVELIFVRGDWSTSVMVDIYGGKYTRNHRQL